MPRRPREDDDDDADDRPRMRKKRRREDEEEYDDEPTGWDRYKGSAPRYVILGILLLVMLVLGFFLFQRYQREQNAFRFDTPVTAT